MSRIWNAVKHHFEGHPQYLVEVFFEGMNEDSWKLLFDWLVTQDLSVMAHYGYVDQSELSYKDYIADKANYVVTYKVKEDFYISLGLFELNELEFSIELEEVGTEAEFDQFLTAMNDLAALINCQYYFICPEFKKDEKFIVNGELA